MAEVLGPIFVDTSIQIASKVHGPVIQASIRSRLNGRTDIVSGLVVRQEYKRRLLKAANYLLRQLGERDSYNATRRHVQDHLPPKQGRLKSISQQLLTTVDEVDEYDDDADRTFRAKLLYRDLIRNSIATSEAAMKLNESSGCACAKQPIVEKGKFSLYEFGTDECSKLADRCGVRAFLNSRRTHLVQIRDYLAGLPAPDKTNELVAAEAFIDRFLADESITEASNPCLEVGDLLVALESIDCETMYTLNWKESRHLAKVLGQSLVYRPPNGDNSEAEYPASVTRWLAPH